MTENRTPEHDKIDGIRGHSDMVKQTEAQLRAVKKYQDKNILQIKINLHRTYDKEIIDKLQSVESKQRYIKDLIRKDIEQGEK